MKQIKVEILKLDLPLFTQDYKGIIQIAKFSEFAEQASELIEIKCTELNQFLDNPVEVYLTESIKKKYNPLLQHKDEEIGEVVFQKAKLTLDKSE